MRYYLVLAIASLQINVYAQNDIQVTDEAGTPVTEDKDSVRRYYIKQFPEYFFLYPVLKQRGLNFEISGKDAPTVLTYKPNNTYNLGIGGYLFELVLELSIAIPIKEQSIERFGESDSRDIQLNILTKRWGVDLLYQRYEGFYIIDRENLPDATEPYPQRPDLVTNNSGFTWHYVFNNQKFSFRSAYNFVERQLYSSGSPLLFAAVNTFRVAGDSAIIGGQMRNYFDNDIYFTRLRYTSFSIAPGYTYNLTYNNFFLNTTLAFGPAHYWINYNLEGQSSRKYDTSVNSFLGARVAVGYNGYKLFGGVIFISQGSSVRFDRETFSNNNSTFKVVAGYRFREKGILKKRVWDMVPFL